MLQRWYRLACNALPSQTTKFQYLGTIATALSHFLLYLGCVHDGLRFRIFAKGKPSVSFHHPLFPASFGQNQPSCASYRRRTPFLRLLLLCPLPFKRRELSMLQADTPPLRASRLPQLVLPTLWRHLVRSLCMRRANEIAPFGHCRTQRSQLKSMIAVSLPLALMRLSQRESHRVTKPKYWVKVVRLQKKKEQLALLLWSKGQRSNFLCPHMSPATPTYLSEQVMNSAVSIGAASQ